MHNTGERSSGLQVRAEMIYLHMQTRRESMGPCTTGSSVQAYEKVLQQHDKREEARYKVSGAPSP